MSIPKDRFRRLMGCFATGVTVVTTLKHGQLRGLTVNAFSSVSLEPTLVLICIDRKSESFDALRQGKAFAVNFLRSNQVELSELFATKGTEKFKKIPYRLGEMGMPILDGTLAYAECRVVAEYPGGDHTIFVGEVETAHIEGGAPLLFFQGSYAAWPPNPAPSKGHAE